MALPSEDIIRHVAHHAKLSVAWCTEMLHLLAIEDQSRVVRSELARLDRAFRTMESKKKPGSDTLAWNETDVRGRLESKAHHLYAAKAVRPLILESVSLMCWDSVVGYYRREHGYKNTDEDWRQAQKQVAKQLGVDGSTVTRWEKYETVPDGDKVLGAVLIALESEITDIGFASRPTILSQTAWRCLGLIRECKYPVAVPKKYSGAAGRESWKRAEQTPSAEELWAVRAVLCHEFADVFLADPEDRDESQSDDLLTDVYLMLEEVFPDGAIRKEETLPEVVGAWAIPYALFRIALVSGWPDGTEDEWNWGDIDDDGAPV